VVDRFVAAVAWRARSTDLSFWFMVAPVGQWCTLSTATILYQTIYQFISYRFIQIVFWFFWRVESPVLIWIWILIVKFLRSRSSQQQSLGGRCERLAKTLRTAMHRGPWAPFEWGSTFSTFLWSRHTLTIDNLFPSLTIFDPVSPAALIGSPECLSSLSGLRFAAQDRELKLWSGLRVIMISQRGPNRPEIPGITRRRFSNFSVCVWLCNRILWSTCACTPAIVWSLVVLLVLCLSLAVPQSPMCHWEFQGWVIA
jgi:hypothetical protein